jgi:hypothetical protein
VQPHRGRDEAEREPREAGDQRREEIEKTNRTRSSAVASMDHIT